MVLFFKGHLFNNSNLWQRFGLAPLMLSAIKFQITTVFICVFCMYLN